MPSTSVPPSKKNPVGSFDSAGLDNATDLPTIVNKIDANDTEQDDTPNALTEDQESLEKDYADDEGDFGTGSKEAFRIFLQQKLADRKTASTEKQFQRLIMDMFQKVQDWNSRYTGLLSTSGVLVTDEQKSEISDYIIDYISIIRNNCNGAENAKIDKDTLQHRHDAEMIWTLFLILFESTMTRKRESVVGELRNWIDAHLPLDLTPLDSTDEFDWEFVQRLILNGDTRNAGEYFTTFADNGREYSALSNILSIMPELPTSISTSYGHSDWAKDWDHWHLGMESLWNEYVQSNLIDVDGGDDVPGLLSVMKILMGDKKMIQKSGMFGQKCLATLIYSDPRSHQFIMQKIANQVYDPMVDGDSMSVLMYNMLDGDFDRLLGSLDDNLWMQVHFGHLLLVTGYIPSEADDDEPQDTLNTQEQVTEPIYYLLKLYAMEISQKYGMWTEAMECIMVCRSNRNIWIKELLGEPPLASEDLDYLKDVLKFCTAHKLTAIEATLYSAIAKRYESSEDVESAAINYADANDIDALDRMANEDLKLYLENGTMRPVVTESKYIELVDRSRPYSFYRRYYELNTHSKDMQSDEPYQSTVALLQSLDYVPQKYRVVLLIDLFGLTKEYSSTKKQDYLLMLQQLDQAVKDVDQKAFISTYYQRTHTDTNPPLSTDTIIEKLRQRFGFCFAADMLSL